MFQIGLEDQCLRCGGAAQPTPSQRVSKTARAPVCSHPGKQDAAGSLAEASEARLKNSTRPQTQPAISLVM